MKTLRQAVIMALAIIVIAAPAMAGFLTAAGYTSTETANIPVSGYVGSFDRSGDDYLLFADRNVMLIDSTGAVKNPAFYSYTPDEFPGYFFASFVKVIGDTAYLGESSTGTIRTLSMTTGASSYYTTAANNYDMITDFQGRKFIVAANADWTASGVWYLSDSGQMKLVGEIPGAAGPAQFDQAGNLYCAAYTYSKGNGIIYKWTADEVAGAMTGETPLGASENAVYASNIYNPSAFTVDASGNLYYSSYELKPGTIWKINSSDASISEFAKANVAGSSLTGLRYDASTGSFYTIGSWTETIKVWDDTTGGYVDKKVAVTKIGTLAPAVPEPSSLMALACGLVGVGGAVIRRRR